MRETDRTYSQIIEELIAMAEEGGYTHDHELYPVSRLVMGTSYYALIFREDFAKPVFGEGQQYEQMMAQYKVMEEQGSEVDYSTLPLPYWKRMLEGLATSEDKYTILEQHLDAVNNKEDFAKKKREELMAKLRNNS